MAKLHLVMQWVVKQRHNWNTAVWQQIRKWRIRWEAVSFSSVYHTNTTAKLFFFTYKQRKCLLNQVLITSGSFIPQCLEINFLNRLSTLKMLCPTRLLQFPDVNQLIKLLQFSFPTNTDLWQKTHTVLLRKKNLQADVLPLKQSPQIRQRKCKRA